MSKSKWKHPNAQKHAVFSKFLTLGGEDSRQFQELVDETAEEWQPEGTSEHDAVLEIAKGIWRKRRFQLFLMVEAIKNAGNPDHPSYDLGIGLQNFLTRAKISPADAFSSGSQFLSKAMLEALETRLPFFRNILPALRNYTGSQRGIDRKGDDRCSNADRA
jgi:hypothetical protein